MRDSPTPEHKNSQIPLETITQAFRYIDKVCELYFENEHHLVEAYINLTDLDADEYLYQQVLIDLVEKLNRIKMDIEFLNKQIKEVRKP